MLETKKIASGILQKAANYETISAIIKRLYILRLRDRLLVIHQ